MRRHHLDPSGLVSRPITKADFDSADYIVCMDDMNKRNLLRMAPASDRHKIYQAFDIVPGKEGTVIPDPGTPTGSRILTAVLLKLSRSG